MASQSGTTLNDGQDNDDWVRRFTLPEEYLIHHYPSARGGMLRWFESKNVIDLVRIRRRRQQAADN
jgi:hypothetical protein